MKSPLPWDKYKEIKVDMLVNFELYSRYSFFYAFLLSFFYFFPIFWWIPVCSVSLIRLEHQSIFQLINYLVEDLPRLSICHSVRGTSFWLAWRNRKNLVESHWQSTIIVQSRSGHQILCNRETLEALTLLPLGEWAALGKWNAVPRENEEEKPQQDSPERMTRAQSYTYDCQKKIVHDCFPLPYTYQFTCLEIAKL